jgi:hypothetical protein
MLVNFYYSLLLFSKYYSELVFLLLLYLCLFFSTQLTVDECMEYMLIE